MQSRGQTLDMGDGVVATVLNPDPTRHYCDLNNNSIAIRLTYGKTAILLAADDGFDAEESMLVQNGAFAHKCCRWVITDRPRPPAPNGSRRSSPR